MDKEGSQLIRGLEGVVAAETQLCDLDGKNGRLAYRDRKSTRLNSSHSQISYAVFCLKKKNKMHRPPSPPRMDIILEFLDDPGNGTLIHAAPGIAKTPRPVGMWDDITVSHQRSSSQKT